MSGTLKGNFSVVNIEETFCVSHIINTFSIYPFELSDMRNKFVSLRTL